MAWRQFIGHSCTRVHIYVCDIQFELQIYYHEVSKQADIFFTHFFSFSSTIYQRNDFIIELEKKLSKKSADYASSRRREKQREDLQLSVKKIDTWRYYLAVRGFSNRKTNKDGYKRKRKNNR